MATLTIKVTVALAISLFFNFVLISLVDPDAVNTLFNERNHLKIENKNKNYFKVFFYGLATEVFRFFNCKRFIAIFSIMILILYYEQYSVRAIKNVDDHLTFFAQKILYGLNDIKKEIDDLFHFVKKNQDAIKIANAKLDVQAEKIKAMKNQLTQLQNELELKTNLEENSNKKITELQVELKNYSKYVNTLGKEIEEQNEKIKNLNETDTTQNKEIEEQNEKIQNLVNAAENQNKEIHELKKYQIYQVDKEMLVLEQKIEKASNATNYLDDLVRLYTSKEKVLILKQAKLNAKIVKKLIAYAHNNKIDKAAITQKIMNAYDKIKLNTDVKTNELIKRQLIPT